MTAILERNSTGATVVCVSRMGTVDIPRVQLLATFSYQDWGRAGINNSGADILPFSNACQNVVRPSDLGWDRQQTLETRFKLSSFEEDWLFPGMEAYDNL